MSIFPQVKALRQLTRFVSLGMQKQPSFKC